MLTLSKLSDYAIVLASCLCTHDACTASAQTLARETAIPLPTVVKLLKLLTAGGTLRSIQGRRGGYRLQRAPSEVPLTEIIEAVDGPIALTECNRETGDCRIQNRCRVHKHWLTINGALRQTLTSISLADLNGPALPIDSTLRFNRSRA